VGRKPAGRVGEGSSGEEDDGRDARERKNRQRFMFCARLWLIDVPPDISAFGSAYRHLVRQNGHIEDRDGARLGASGVGREKLLLHLRIRGPAGGIDCQRSVDRNR
jgi:hypothetical protein